MVCRERPARLADRTRLHRRRAPADAGRRRRLLGQTPRAALVWTRDDGFDACPVGPPAGGPLRDVGAAPLPDGSLRMVTGTPSRRACTYVLRVSSPGDADLAEVARTTEPAPVADCGTYLDGPGSAGALHPDDPRADFWFVRDGDDWSTTRTDPGAQS